MSRSLLRRVGGAMIVTVSACGGRQAQVSSPAASSAQAPAPAAEIDINDGESLIRAMHARYNGRWPQFVTYTQTQRLLGQSGQNADQLQYVALAPGRQRIDYVNPSLGNGLLARADSVYNFSNGRQVGASQGWTELLVLTQDVYHQRPEVTISVLRSLGFQLSRIQSQSFDGRRAFVIGATSQNDSSSKQFWVERDRLVLVRIRERRGQSQFSDVRIGSHTKAGEGFVGRQTVYLVNGAPRLQLLVGAITPNAALDSALFDPKQWSTAKHWSKP
jgi:hypothetical protein